MLGPCPVSVCLEISKAGDSTACLRAWSNNHHSKIFFLYLTGGSLSASCDCCISAFCCLLLRGAQLCRFSLFPAEAEEHHKLALQTSFFQAQAEQREAATFLLGYPVLPPHSHTTFLCSYSNFQHLCRSRASSIRCSTHNYLAWEKSPTSNSWLHYRWLSLQAHAADLMLNWLSTRAQVLLLQRLYSSLLESAPHSFAPVFFY